MRGPKEVMGHVGGSVTVTCDYEASLATLRKLWCQERPWGLRRILVETNGTEQEVKKDRVTLRDSPREHRFTVTMERLRLNDTDTYSCGIAYSDSVMYVPVKVYVSQGRWLCMSHVPTLLRAAPGSLSWAWSVTLRG